MITVVCPHIHVFLVNDFSRIPTNICNQKVVMSLCEHDSFLLTNYDLDKMFDDIVGGNRVEYDNKLSE